MAIEKTILTDTGYEANYWSVGYFSLNKSRSLIDFTLFGYKDITAYLDKSDKLQEIKLSYTLNTEDPGVAPYDCLNIMYTSYKTKYYNISLSNTVSEEKSIQADIQQLINQVLGGCYINAKETDQFKEALDV